MRANRCAITSSDLLILGVRPTRGPRPQNRILGLSSLCPPAKLPHSPRIAWFIPTPGFRWNAADKVELKANPFTELGPPRLMEAQKQTAPHKGKGHCGSVALVRQQAWALFLGTRCASLFGVAAPTAHAPAAKRLVSGLTCPRVSATTRKSLKTQFHDTCKHSEVTH